MNLFIDVIIKEIQFNNKINRSNQFGPLIPLHLADIFSALFLSRIRTIKT